MAPRKEKIPLWQKQLHKQYFTPKQSGSFSGVQKLQKALKQKRRSKKIQSWLSSQDTYTLHKPVRHHFTRGKIIVNGIDDQWQADLADMHHLAPRNKGYKYILTCIDILSKYAWAVLIKDKSAQSLVKAFGQILKQGRKPNRLQTDQGKEFVNALLQQFLKRQGIAFFTTYNEEIKASVVERFNRTLKTKMWKYFTQYHTDTYIDVLEDLVWSYNHTYHRSIKMCPVDVTHDKEELVWQTLYGQDRKFTPPKLAVGDYVRISKVKHMFRKGYLPNWSQELYIIEMVLKHKPVRYVIKDEKGEVLKGSFYEPELQKVVKKDNIYQVEAILDERKRQKQVEVLVKWVGYPDKFNSWINKKELIRYKKR